VPCVIQCHGNGGYVLYPENPVALSDLLGECGVPFAFQTFPDVGHATYQLGEAAARPIADFFRTRFCL
jgi:hypothetical protein